MPSPELTSTRRRDVDAEYYYRRPLAWRELLPAIGIGVGAGLLAFYITGLLLQRTPLHVERGAHKVGRSRHGARSPDRTARP